MLQLITAAYLASPLMIYVPPIRRLNMLVESLEFLLHHISSMCNITTILRFRLFFSTYFSIPPVLLSSPPPPTLR
ncbi:hypothetical protein A4A49_23646 [Nicotiana attenuata]|uniref:Uncharacterized protein n=1 Tax=Nicotiana attenuata TaxID=49451 RepID=A0A314KWG1_NICAT|nr:hypothetical protein A4A49_23646 [Nicotiana attenuata]